MSMRDPGRVTMRRLNQTEYDNTVRDLLGTSLQPARIFISDSQATGFDNNGDLLGLSPVRVEQYQLAAETLATDALSGPLRARNLSCDPASGDPCVRTLLTTLGERAFRRPLSEDEIARFLQLAGKVRLAGGSPDDVVRAVLQALLMSPNFLFRAEYDLHPASLTPHLLGPYEVASRLSYLVYGSMPDEALLAAARNGKLGTAADVQSQLQRMLSDPKERFSQTFVEQWLGIRAVDTLQPDVRLFPNFNAALGASMKREAGLLFDEFIRRNLPVEQLLTANFTYLDVGLAKHYGLPEQGTDTEPVRVELTTSQRGGLLSMAAFLTATSRGNRTSPVERGRFVLDVLMCAPPPPPPSDVAMTPEEQITALSEREFLAVHRRNPTCAACHNLMDPIGLALENYDATGAWRDTDHGQKIDPSGVLPNGIAVSGPRDLSAALARDERLLSCLASGLLTYALGRSLLPSDNTYVEELAKGPRGASVGLRDMLIGIVSSEPFRMRRGEVASVGGQ
ncbi:MAG TPA: DUF1592 domain-containing protein [Polyangia bacterium]